MLIVMYYSMYGLTNDPLSDVRQVQVKLIIDVPLPPPEGGRGPRGYMWWALYRTTAHQSHHTTQDFDSLAKYMYGVCKTSCGYS